MEGYEQELQGTTLQLWEISQYSKHLRVSMLKARCIEKGDDFMAHSKGDSTSWNVRVKVLNLVKDGF